MTYEVCVLGVGTYEDGGLSVGPDNVQVDCPRVWGLDVVASDALIIRVYPSFSFFIACVTGYG